MKLRFDHSYGTDQNFRFRQKLHKAGFSINDYEVEHPGKAFCRFIYLPRTKKTGFQYLEFVHFGKGGTISGIPGLSLGALQPLEPFSKKLKAKGVETKFVHKNYDWKKNDKDRLPGWNFVSFPKHKSRVYTWLTEYEKIPGKKKRRKKVKHPNQVYKIVEIETVLNKADQAFFQKLFGRPRNGRFLLSCGTPLAFEAGKTSRIRNIVLATKDLNTLVRKFCWDELTTYQGRPAALLKNPNRKMWDVIIVQDV